MRSTYPGATQRLIAPGSNDPAIIPIGIIWHVDAGNSKSLYGYFKDKSGGIESHQHFPSAGRPEQYRVFGREADANLKANSFRGKDGKTYGYISNETQGYEAGEWNSHQLDEMKAFALWARDNLGIPLVKCAGPFSPGHGFHTMWGAPSEWTPVAKSCPGPKRIEQFNEVFVPWMRQQGKPSGGVVTVADPEDGDEYGGHYWSKRVALQLQADLRALGVAFPAPPTPKKKGDAYFGHYWAKYAALLLSIRNGVKA